VIDDLARGILFRAFPHDPPLTADELRLAEQNMLSSRPDLTSAPIHASLYQALEDSFRSGTVQQWDSVEGPAALLRTIRTDALQYYFHRAGPYGEADLAEASRQLLGETAAKQGTTFEELIGHSGPFTAREWKHIAGRLDVPPLALDQYVAYEMPRLDLGVTARVPGWILFLPLLLWLIWNLISCLSFLPAGFRADGGLGLWLAGLGIAPAVAVAFNPTWWNETLPQLAHYYQISVGRQGSLPDIEIFYLGKKFFYSLPWHNGWILMAVTVPLAIGMIALLGIASAIWNWRRDPLRMFFLLQMITLPVSRMLPTPAHDGVRLMLPTFFFLAGLAGWGFEWIQQFVERLRSESYSPAPVLGVAAAFLLIPPGYWLYRSHPYELSYYNGLVGGLKGAQRAGFEPTYWYDAVTPQVVHDLNDSQRGIPLTAVLSLPEPQSILAASFPEGAHLTQLLKSLPERRINPQVFEELWLTRQLRRDIRVSGIRGVPPELDDFPYVALLTHSSKASPFTRLLYGLKPRASWEHEGVRLFSLYDPIAVARAWGLWILIDATDYSRPRIEPSLDRAMVDVARNNYRALYAAALRITETGLDKAMELEDDPQTILVLRKLASRRAFLQMVLARRKDALIESVEILSRTAEKRPELLEQLIESYDGYLPASELGRFLDEPTE
jgi:hypothetical protein